MTRFVRARKAGQCDSAFPHDRRIEPGDIVSVTTHYPRSEAVRDFGVAPFSRTRRCERCVISEQAQQARRGGAALALRDRHGDVWKVTSRGRLMSPETALFDIEHVRRKWGPLTVVRGGS